MSLPFLLDPKAEGIPPPKSITPEDKWEGHRRSNKDEMWEYPTRGDIVSNTPIKDGPKGQDYNTHEGMNINSFFKHTTMNVITHTHYCN